MRVLYCWNTAGISSIINHYMGQAYNHTGTVIMRRSHDPYGISAYYSPPCRLVGKGMSGAWAFYLATAMTSPRQNVLHICAGIEYMGLFKKISMGGKVVLHYHGSDVRNVPYDSRMDAERHADHIMVATQDLLDYKYSMEPTYIPNPVDTGLFPPCVVPDNNRGLVFMKPGQKQEPTLQRLRDLGFGDIEWDLATRSYDANAMATVPETCFQQPGRFDKVQYRDMPALLSKYQYYGEIYHNVTSGSWYTADSATGLQAMSLGLAVIRHDGSVVKELPPEHKPEEVAARVKTVYDTLLE